MERPVVVLGGGSQGLTLADELSRLGVPVVVVDQSPFGAFSSTRNQGWLQSGAYYAARDDDKAALACASGHRRVLDRFPDVVRSETASRYLFTSENDRDESVDKCRALGIECEPISDRQFRTDLDTLPLLQGSPLRFGALTADRPVDTTSLLGAISAQAADRGARFRSVRSVADVDIRRHPAGWSVVFGPGDEIDTDVVVVAAGPLLADVVRGIRPSFADGLKVTKVPVLSLTSSTSLLASSMLVTPKGAYGPNLVPFKTSSGSGATLCLSADDRDCDGRGAFDDDQPDNARSTFEQRLGVSFPNLLDSTGGWDITAHVYMCQKIKPVGVGADGLVSRQHIEDWHTEGHDDGTRTLVSMYPGKFTAAADLSEALAAKIADGFETTGEQSPQSPPPVARQRYYDRDDLRLVEINGLLVLEDR